MGSLVTHAPDAAHHVLPSSPSNVHTPASDTLNVGFALPVNEMIPLAPDIGRHPTSTFSLTCW